MENINPCKCGSKNKPILDSDDFVPCWSIYCRDCKQDLHSENYSHDGAIIVWNKENPKTTID